MRSTLSYSFATNDKKTWQSLALVWGVEAHLFEKDRRLDTMIARMTDVLKEKGKLRTGDQVVVFSGRTPEQSDMKLVGVREVR